MKNILVLRLSSMGDVLLTLPVMRGILTHNPDIQLVFVTRKRFVPYFAGIERLVVVPFNPGGTHKGLSGIFTLFGEVRQYRFNQVIDLHGILRTYILDILFQLSGCQVFRINKHRKLRREILEHPETDLSVPHTADRYLAVFEQAGLTGEISKEAFAATPIFSKPNLKKSDIKRIGIAPLSKHQTKNWGIPNIITLISLLRSNYQVEIHLFGGIEDLLVLEGLADKNVINHAGVINTEDEISIVRQMDVFVSMDSANMHLASLAGVPTVSVWGATDPRLGFAAMYQPEDYTLQASREDVPCRPCSVYGEVPCWRTDFPMLCMTLIRPEQVLNKIGEILNKSQRN